MKSIVSGMASAEIILPLRITVVDPPTGVRFRLQRGRADLVAPVTESSAALRFELEVRVGKRPSGAPNFLGPFAQGPADARFVYVNAGTLAGQPDSCWSRRAKIPLAGITWDLIERTRSAGVLLEARMRGVGSDGGPTCATVKGTTWKVSAAA
jgi:hypothetical protein